MIVSDLAVKNRTTVFVLTALLVAAGIYCYLALPREAAPDITIPNVFVYTFYRGVSPEDIEKSITMEIEKKLKGLDGVKKISSVSAEGLSSINVEFMTDVDIDQAVIDVKDKVDLAKPDLPSDLEEEPYVEEFNFSDLPILSLSLAGPAGLRELTVIAEDLEEEIEGISGVQEVDVLGGVEREIHIEIDPERMTMYGISFGMVQGIVAGENQNVSGGSIRTEEGRYQLRVPGEFDTTDEVESIVIATRNGQPVYLRDVAKVIDGIKDRESVFRLNGRTSVGLLVRKRTGKNIIEIVDEVYEIIERLRPSWPPGTEIAAVSDEGQKIREMVADLENNIITGLLLVILVVCLAMGLRNAILVSLSIPLSMLLAFVVLKMLGINLNMVVLFSLTLALGMLVDNAIVIIENIYRFMQQGVPRVEAAMRATSEVAFPIVGSALTTIGAFLPLLWWTGIMGEWMVYLPKTVIITLASCLFVALIINPALAAVLMRADGNGKTASADEVMAGGEHPMLSGGGGILAAYRWLLRRALDFRLGVVAASGFVLIGTIMLWWLAVGVRTPMEFFPSIDPDMSYVNIKLPEGADLQYADGIVREIACRIFDPDAGTTAEDETGRKGYEDCLHFREETLVSTGETYLSPSYYPDVEYVRERASVAANPGSAFQEGADNQVAVMFSNLPDRHASSKETSEKIYEKTKDIPGAEINVVSEGGGPPTGAAINIEISGHDFALLGQTAEKVKAIVREVPFVKNVRDDYEQGSPTIRIAVDRKRAGMLGLTTNDIGSAIRSAINGTEVSSWRTSEDDYDIMVRFLDDDRKKIQTLRRLMLPSAVAGGVPLTTIADIEYVGGVGQITRIDHRRVVTVKADVDETQTTGVTARLDAEERMKDFAMPPGVRYSFTGENEFQQESEEFLTWAMMVALLIIVFVLVAQFNSLSLPLVIMSAVILSLAGAFLGLTVFGMPFGLIMTGVGVISLAGVVVNNAIVLVDYTEQLRHRGLPLHDAIIAAGATRLRPVVLTAVTTILGLIPMVSGISVDFHPLGDGKMPTMIWASESSQWWGPMAVAVIFGLGLATILTLLVVPVLISLTDTLAHLLEATGLAPTLAWVVTLAFVPPLPWLVVFLVLLLSCALGRARIVYPLVRVWWRIYDRRHGTSYADSWKS